MENALSLPVADDYDVVAPRTGASYDEDIHAWAMRQAEFIRLGRFHELDIENLADEVEDVARREREELVYRLSLVVQHLLKWDYQPERRSASWARTLREQRRQVSDIIAESPSLCSRLPALCAEAFRQGRIAALNETEFADDAIPEVSPFSWEELMTRPIIWPESQRS